MADSATIIGNVLDGGASSSSVTTATIVTGNVALAGPTIVASVATGGQGLAGTNGTNGTNGQGVPTGGTANQVLSKIDSTNYNTQWVTPASATGASKAFAIAMAVAL